MDFGGQPGNTFQPNGAWITPLTIRLLVPACQCGCLIGKGGVKIKELRTVGFLLIFYQTFFSEWLPAWL